MDAPSARESRELKLRTQSDREIVMRRVFDAPRRLVFDAFTKPELIQKWLLGPCGWTMPVCKIDLRVGGAYRYVWHYGGGKDKSDVKDDSEGKEMGVSGVYREITPPERIVFTERFDEAWYPGEALNTTTFAENEGRTTMTMTILYVSREARDGVLKSGMERGVAMSYARLDEMLASGLVK